jgi:hypothetical protein
MNPRDLVGTWTGTARTWLDPNGEPAVAPYTCSFRPVLDGPSVIGESQSAVGESVSNGVMLLGSDIGTGTLALSWVDTFHTGGNVMTFAGDAAAMLGQWAAGGEVWRWRIAFAVSGDELRVEHTNITPDGTEARGIEIVCRRA